MYERFLDPTMDVAFKKVFGDQRKADILISFLNSILERNPGALINEVTILDPNNHPETVLSKQTIVDLKCKDEKGLTYIVEMQVINKFKYLDRAEYYTCLEVSRQLNKRAPYAELNPVIFVAVANFKLFDNEFYVNHHLTLNTKTFRNELTLTEYHFLELPKFNKKPEELASVIDQWAYFLKYAGDIDKVPKELNNNEEILEAFEVLEHANYTKSELELYDKEIDIFRTELTNQIGKEELENHLKGSRQALEYSKRALEDTKKALEDSKEEIKLIAYNESLKIAKKLLDKGLEFDQISQITGLSLNDIKKLI